MALRGLLVSLLGTLVVVCSGCGGRGGDGNSASMPAAQRTPEMQIVAMASQPVMGRGATGTWDSVDVLNPSVIQFQGKLLDYYSGYDGAVWRTGLATSTDNGLTWTKTPSPVLDLGQWDTKYIAANGAGIVVNGQMYHYFHGEGSDGHQKIGLATSADGQSFTMRPDPVLSVGQPGAWDDLHVADPYVIRVGSQYWMYYLAVSHDYRFNMGRATSSDGLTWQKEASPIFGAGAKGDFDEDGVGEAAVVYQAPYYYMIYVGADAANRRSLGWASSTDGKTWTKRGQLIPDSMRQPWDSQVICDPTILPTGTADGTYYVWFGGGDVPNSAQNIHGQIGRTTVKLN